jgi:hypothetical protein
MRAPTRPALATALIGQCRMYPAHSGSSGERAESPNLAELRIRIAEDCAEREVVILSALPDFGRVY